MAGHRIEVKAEGTTSGVSYVMDKPLRVRV